MPQEGGDGERRRLVFTNLVNGLGAAAIMSAFHMSDAEVWADFEFCISKIRDYRFKRAQNLIPCATVAEARANRGEVLYTLARLNLGTPPEISNITTLPMGQGDGASEGERAMDYLAMKAARR